MSMPTNEQIKNSLWNAFANNGLTLFPKAQKEDLLVAIQIGLSRIRETSKFYAWDSSCANKDHKCKRGCIIREGDIYFKYITGIGWGQYLKICAGCMAMILYYMKAYELPDPKL